MTLQELPEFLPERNSETITVSVKPTTEAACANDRLAAASPATRSHQEVRDRPGCAHRHETDVDIYLRFCHLTSAEHDVFALLAEGHGGEGISRRLGVTDLAFEFQRMQVFQKMSASSLVELLVMAKICALD